MNSRIYSRYSTGVLTIGTQYQGGGGGGERIFKIYFNS